LSLSNGQGIPIEERAAAEVVSLYFSRPIAPKGIKVYNPACDVTSHKLISAIITEKGIIKPPYQRNIRKLLC
jgi:methylthioribose-1-phosphate isomerase